MPLKLYPRPNGIFHIRGTVQGRRVDESARTRIRAEAEALRAKLEADIFKRAVYGDKSVATFAEAAAIYMEAGKPNDHLATLIAEIGLRKLSDIDQNFVDTLAKRLKPKGAPATRIRQIYTPISSVMNFSAPKLCDPVRFAKPKGAGKRVDQMTPREVEIMLGFLPDHLRRLVIFYVATGCRATEALNLEWRDVSPDGQRVVFWETKAGYSRGVDLQKRARLALPTRPDDGEGFVWLNSDGEPWAAYDSLNTTLKKHCARRRPDGSLIPVKERATYEGPRFRPVHCHLFRHTWATWAYAVTRDLTFLMGQGGWKSASMVMRYAHTASPDLAAAVKAAGWEIRRRGR
ncbi:tyrosine-type recombinase/integrase [Phenylobacterium sp.]|uniref:tyrosine-type recombinase/integrase n=1 Tax=Phenylobacterium sp. TaxID=1871053 RepID=UPI0030F3D372